MSNHLDIDCNTSEVKNIHPAIVKKLAESLKIDINKVDKDLVQYSLLLFENRNTKEGIINELNLFFKDGTCVQFVDWLWRVLAPISEEQKRPKFSLAKKYSTTPPKKSSEALNPKKDETKTEKQKPSVQNNPKTTTTLSSSVPLEKDLKETRNNTMKGITQKIQLSNETTPEETQLKYSTKKIETVPLNKLKNQTIRKKRETSPRKRRKDAVPRFISRKSRDDKSAKPPQNDPSLTQKGNIRVELPAKNTERPPKKVSSSVPFQSNLRRSIKMCQFWPNCIKGEQCPFTHPQEICTYYPSCIRGKNCLFLHVEKGQFKPPSLSGRFSANAATTTNCFYGSSCNNALCRFAHPPQNMKITQGIPCRYGEKCQNANCTFAHQINRTEATNGGTTKAGAETEAQKGTEMMEDEKEGGDQRQLCRFDKKCQAINCALWHPLRERELKSLIAKVETKSK